jgi:hypothetical protein
VSTASPCTVFLLSPAHCGGRRAGYLTRSGSTLPLTARLDQGTLSLGEAFAFMSGLYFRGKLAYARVFGRRADGPPALVITPTRGLQVPELPVTRALLAEFAALDVAAHDPRYVEPPVADARALARTVPSRARIVLLGSIATSKYVEVLAGAFGDRLHFPPAFIGRGDMSRGALMLRSAASGVELDYIAASSAATRRGPRPPRLDARPRPARSIDGP